MSVNDLDVVSTTIDRERDFLNNISQEIWKTPELQYKEVQAHATLTSALRRNGFQVEKHYFMPTAFRAEFSSKTSGGPTVAIMLEYDALPELGHACGHNLIAEAGLAAALGVKAALLQDDEIKGKIVLLGSPAEEGGGGKIRLLELGAFDDVDVALMAHPGRRDIVSPTILHNLAYSVEYKGKEAHAALNPWYGVNALDAAVACYQNLSLLRQQTKTTSRIHILILKGGAATNIIPSSSSMAVKLRTVTRTEMQRLRKRVEACITSAAEATGCEVQFRPDESNSYQSLISNAVLVDLYEKYWELLGFDTQCLFKTEQPVGSTDMGNVSQVVPSIHPIYTIGTEASNHTIEFTEAAGSPEAQEYTIGVGKILALIALQVMRSKDVLKKVKEQFQSDIKSEDEMDEREKTF